MTVDPSKTTVDPIIDLNENTQEIRMLNTRRALIICLSLAAIALIATGLWMGHKLNQHFGQMEVYRAQDQRAKEQELQKLRGDLEKLQKQLEKPAAAPAPTPVVAPSAPAPATTPAAAPATDEKVATTTAPAYEHKIAAGEDASLLERACSLQAKHDGQIKVIPTNAVELERSRKINEVASNDKLPAAVDTTIKISCDLRTEALGWAKFRRTQLASAQ